MLEGDFSIFCLNSAFSVFRKTLKFRDMIAKCSVTSSFKLTSVYIEGT